MDKQDSDIEEAQNSDNQKTKEEENYMAEGMSIGLCLGLALGELVFGSMTLGMCVGLCLGLAVGAGIKKKQIK